jgi:hypothetical protein
VVRRAILPLVIAAALAGACELIAGIEDVIDARDAGADGGACDPPPDLDGGRDDCGEGLANCTPNGSCATALATDPTHCGHCGHDCRGADCTDGRCAPEPVTTALDPFGIALHAGMVYWTDGSNVHGAPVGATAPTKTWFGAEAVRGLAVDDSGVYWGYYDQACLGRALHTSNVPTTLGACAGTFGGKMAVDATHVYWVVRQQNGSPCTSGPDCCGPSDTGCVMRIDKEGKEPASFFVQAEEEPTTLAVDETHVYWGNFVNGVNEGSIKRCPKDGCAGSPEVFEAAAGSPADMVFDGDHLYWLDRHHARVVRKSRKPGAALEILNQQQGGDYYGAGVAVDDLYVYWAGGDRVYRAPKHAGASAEPIGGDEPYALARDCTYLYWTQQGVAPSVARAVR